MCSRKKTLMDTDTSLIVLNRVADELTEADLKYIKFLVIGIGDISRMWLENASAKDIILMLKERNGDMSIFAELLHVIGRQDLFEVVNVFANTQTSSQLPVSKILMFHIAQSMSEEDRQIARWYFNVKDDDSIELMTLIETRTPVRSVDELRQAMSELQLSHLYDKARNMAAAADSNDVGRSKRVTRPPPSLLRMLSFCDGTGCDDGCPYRDLWSEKFPNQLSPVFSNERLLHHGDVSTDSEELLGEGRFGKVYKGQ